MTSVVDEDRTMCDCVNQQPTPGPLFSSAELAELTIDLANHFRSAFEQANIELIVDCPPLTKLSHVDVGMWRQIFQKLLSNAFKLTPRGKIIIRLKEIDKLAEFRVQDTGVGIPTAQLSRLIGRFSRQKADGDLADERTGIGLALVAELVVMYGGEFSVESIVGGGTSFVVRIPSGTAHLAERFALSSFVSNSTTHRSKYAVGEATRLLSAEDAKALETLRTTAVEREPSDSEVRGVKPPVVIAGIRAETMAYLLMLLSEDDVIEVASDNPPAWDLMRKSAPSLLRIDNIRSQVDGLELLRQIRADRQIATLPVVVLSLKATPENRVEGMEAGADEILIEPFSDGELLACIVAHLKIGRLRRSMYEAAKKCERQFESLLQGNSDVAYRMSQDWKEMRYLKGKDFLADPPAPNLSGMGHYIPVTQPAGSGPGGGCSCNREPECFQT